MSRKSILILACVLGVAARAFAAWNPEQEKVVKDYGEKAMNAFYGGEYSQAIYLWQEILKIDPSQTQPPKLIRQAREKLQEKLTPLVGAFYAAVKKGEYSEAQAQASQVLTMDPANPDLQTLSARLDDVVKIVPDVATVGRVPELIRTAVSKYVKPAPDVKMAFVALRFAQYLEPDNGAVEKFLQMLDEKYPEESRVTVPTLGPNIIDHKLALALTSFYQGRFDLTVQECREILEFEPDNKTALSRMGSGYYAIGQKAKAREYWAKALKLDPSNKKLRKMLAGLPKEK